MDSSLRIKIERAGKRFRVSTSLDDGPWRPIRVTFPEHIDAREVAFALTNATDAEHVKTIDET